MPTFDSGGLLFPPMWNSVYSGPQSITGGVRLQTLRMDAATEKVAFIGRLFLNGRPASKVISAAGSGKIHFKTATVTFGDPATIIGVGIQDLGTGGPPGQPDGAFDVSTSITGSTAGITANAWNTKTMTNGAKTLSHGEAYAVVFDMSARASTDAVDIEFIYIGTSSEATPYVNTFVAGAWGASPVGLPNCIIETDDGTLGWFDGSIAHVSISSHTISAASAIAESGMMFSIPFTCAVDALFVACRQSSSLADATVRLYSSPKTTPVTVTAIDISGERANEAAELNGRTLPLVNLRTITASTTYALMVGGSLSNVAVYAYTFAAAAHRQTWPHGENLSWAARSVGATSFSQITTAFPQGFGVRIAEIVTGSASTVTVTTTTTITVGAASGMLVHPGMTGGVKG